MESIVQLATDLYQSGRKAMDAGDSHTAAALFRSSIQLVPHFKTLELLGELLLNTEGASAEAVVVLAAASSLGNRQSRPFFLLSKALVMRGDLENAISKLDQAIEMQPTFKQAIEFRKELMDKRKSPASD